MKRARQPAAQAGKQERAAGEVYGYLLHIRGLAQASRSLNLKPLRVLCVLTSFMGEDGRCRVSRSTIADTAGMLRKHVVPVLNLLKDKGLIEFESETGRLTEFRWNEAFIDRAELRTRRPGQDAVEAGREARREAKRLERADSRGASIALRSPFDRTPGVPKSGTPGVPKSRTPGCPQIRDTGCPQIADPKKPLQETSARGPLEESAAGARASPGGYARAAALSLGDAYQQIMSMRRATGEPLGLGTVVRLYSSTPCALQPGDGGYPAALLEFTRQLLAAQG